MCGVYDIINLEWLNKQTCTWESNESGVFTISFQMNNVKMVEVGSEEAVR